MIRALTSTGFLRLMFSQSKNVFQLPKLHQIRHQAQIQINEALERAPTCKVLATILKENIHLCTDLQLGYIFRHMRLYNLTVDETMYSIIIPISLEYINVFNREHAEALFDIVMTALQMKIDNEVLWEALLKKLDEENIYRYFTLKRTMVVLNELLDHPVYKNHSLTRKLITVVYQQKNYYLSYSDTRDMVRQILQKSESLTEKDPQLTEAYKQIV